jgi:hypothetical protein
MKNPTTYSKLFALLLLVNFSFFAQNTDVDVKAKIVLEEVEGNIKITGTAENLTDILQSMTYKLSVIKKNIKTENRSTNNQEGVFTLDANQNKNLSTTQINRSSEDEIIVLLLFYDENSQIVSKDRVVISDEKKKDKVIVLEDGIELVGIVTDETKTKIGKDFYDNFSYLYRDYKINAKQIVKISEELSFGRNTKIIIMVDNDVVYEFLARPDEEFIEAMAKNSLYETYQFLKKLENEKKYITQY